jgi:hypothetical protein
MELEASSNKPPVLTPKRPTYRSYGELIRVLIADATSRVKADKPVSIPPIVVTAPMRKLADDIAALRKKLRAKERELSEKHRAKVEDTCYGGSKDKPKVDYTYTERSRLTDARPAVFHERMTKIKQLRVKATLDTIDMSPVQAKRYLLKLEEQLRKV